MKIRRMCINVLNFLWLPFLILAAAFCFNFSQIEELRANSAISPSALSARFQTETLLANVVEIVLSDYSDANFSSQVVRVTIEGYRSRGLVAVPEIGVGRLRVGDKVAVALPQHRSIGMPNPPLKIIKVVEPPGP